MALSPANSRSAGPTGPAGGDLTGTYPSPTLAAIGSATGPLGTTTRTPAVTIDAKGRVTALTDQAIAFPADAVTSVFARTGAVVAASNDYTIAQIQNAAAAIGGVIWTVVTKSMDESVQSSTTLQADDELLFVAASGGVYQWELMLIYASPAGAGTPDIKVAVGEAGYGPYRAIGISTSETLLRSGALSDGSQTLSFGTAAANRIALFDGGFVSSGATFNTNWAQATSDSNATIVRAGSVLRYRRLL